MKAIKHIFTLLVMFVLMASFSQCSSAQKFQKEAPTELGNVYSQKWTAGIKGGGSGINVFIPISDTSTPLDSIYFRGKRAKLEFIEGDQPLYVGRFKTTFNQPENGIIMSGDSKEEYGNTAPLVDTKIPFELKDNECVVVYKKGDESQYYKISNIEARDPLNYPSAPPNNH